MKVLLDPNVLLDVLLNRAPWETDASLIWSACDRGQIEGWITASTILNISYVARRSTDLVTARIAVGLCLQAFTICPVDEQALHLAISLSGNDFEDNVQIACAIIANLDAIITRDQGHFLCSPVQVLAPHLFASQL